MGVDVGTHLDLLDLDGLLLLAGLGGLLLALIFEPAVVHDLGDGRIVVGGDLDEIEAGLGGDLEGALDGDGTVIGALVVDQLNLADADFLVDARPVLVDRRRCFERSTNGGLLL
jgi:hypothetical protein